MNFIEKVMDKPGVAASLYSIAIIAISMLTGLLAVFNGGSSGIFMIGLVVISVIATVLPLVFLRFYAFSTFSKINPGLKTPTFLIFAMLEVGFILLNLTVYATSVIGDSGLGMGSLFLISIGNVIGIVVFGILAAAMKIWGKIDETISPKSSIEDEDNTNPFVEVKSEETEDDSRSDFRKAFGI